MADDQVTTLRDKVAAELFDTKDDGFTWSQLVARVLAIPEIVGAQAEIERLRNIVKAAMGVEVVKSNIELSLDYRNGLNDGIDRVQNVLRQALEVVNEPV